jgi:hypothetical protein
MEIISNSRFEILTDFEKSMRILIRQQRTTKDEFQHDMLSVLQYISSIKDGVFLASEIKSSFERFLPMLDTCWNKSDYTPLISCTEMYARLLSEQLEKQRCLFDKVNIIVSSLDFCDSEIKTSITSTLIPITIEVKLMKILCEIHNFLFKKDQAKLNEAIEDFLEEFKMLDSDASQPLLQLRIIINQLKVFVDMQSDTKLVKQMIVKVMDIAEGFINKFCGF